MHHHESDAGQLDPSRADEAPESEAALVEADRPLVDAALKLASSRDAETMCATVLELLHEAFDVHASWILLHDRRSNRLVTAATRGSAAEAYRDVDIPPDRGIVGLAFSRGEPVFVPDVKAETRWFDPDRVQRSGLPSIVTVPLLNADEKLGVIGFYSPRFGPDAVPSASDRALLRGFGALATIAVSNARLLQALGSERRERARVSRHRRELLSEVRHLRGEVRHAGAFGHMVGRSQRFREVLEQVSLVAPSDASVLLLGETGTGKELIARAIHESSRRARQILVAVNCAALPPTLIESELFGHEKGAFTGAVERKPGKFELADGGTIFLDEVGDLPLDAQAKLLRVLQEREIQRVGGTRTINVNARLIAATNQDLRSRVATGEFRADLFYRLSVFPLEVPPLRERPEDIPPLVLHFVERFAERQHTRVPAVNREAMEMLQRYDWPGNVRELQNVVERAVLLCKGRTIGEDLLVLMNIRSTGRPVPAEPLTSPLSSPVEPRHVVTYEERERQAILEALTATGWRISGDGGAAQRLGLKPTTLHAKMKRLGVRRPGSAQ